MTLIIGARGSDGVVIGTDRLVLRGGEPSFDNKIHELGNAIFALAGPTGLGDDFLLLLRQELERRRGFTTLYEMKIVVEDIVYELTQRYAQRLEEEGAIGALIGGLSEISRGAAQLYHTVPEGYAETTNCVCLGSGAPYSMPLTKFLVHKELNVEDLAYTIAFIISYVADDVEKTVGGTPVVAKIVDGRPQIFYLDETYIEKAVSHAKRVKRNLRGFLRLTGH